MRAAVKDDWSNLDKIIDQAYMAFGQFVVEHCHGQIDTYLKMRKAFQILKERKRKRIPLSNDHERKYQVIMRLFRKISVRTSNINVKVNGKWIALKKEKIVDKLSSNGFKLVSHGKMLGRNEHFGNFLVPDIKQVPSMWRTYLHMTGKPDYESYQLMLDRPSQNLIMDKLQELRDKGYITEDTAVKIFNVIGGRIVDRFPKKNFNFEPAAGAKKIEILKALQNVLLKCFRYGEDFFKITSRSSGVGSIVSRLSSDIELESMKMAQ